MKIRDFSRTARWIAAALVSVLVVVLWFGIRIARDPYGLFLQSQLREMPAVKNPKSPYSDQATDDMRRLINEMGRKTRWSSNNTEWVVEIIDSGWPDIARPDPYESRDMYEAYTFYNMSLSIIADRVGMSIPLPEEARLSGIQAIVENLDHPQWYIRHSSITYAWSAGLLDRPEILEKFQTMALKDSNERVRENAQRRLDALVPGDG